MADHRASCAVAVLRASLLAVVTVGVSALDARHLGGAAFTVTAAGAGAVALTGIALAATGIVAAQMSTPQSAISLALLTGLVMTSGGAFSDARWAFFVVPLFAAFRERPRNVAGWSLGAVAAFTAQAALIRGHVPRSVNTWEQLTVIQDVYLTWAAAAATVLAVVLRARTARIEALAESRARLVTEALGSVERERTRLAGALHDRPLQALIAARHDLRRAERTGDATSFAEVHRALEETIAELREEIFALHPHVLDHAGLDAAVRQLAHRHARDDGLHVSVEIEPAATALHPDVVFWLARELMGNAARHACARRLQVQLSRRSDSVSLEVTDDGAGIPEGRLRDAVMEGHVGLASIAERVPALGGNLEIATGADRGTTVRVTLPEIVDGRQPRAPSGRQPTDRKETARRRQTDAGRDETLSS